jgi:CheY-like chemotaxis protein
VSEPLRIVIADDEPDTVLTLATLLEQEGHRVYGFGTGREAIAAARMYLADAMIVDIQMPDMTGYEIARTVREQEQRAQLPREPLHDAVSVRWQSTAALAWIASKSKVSAPSSSSTAARHSAVASSSCWATFSAEPLVGSLSEPPEQADRAGTSRARARTRARMRAG